MLSALSTRRANMVLRFSHRRGRYDLLDRGGYESRNSATAHLLIEALARCKEHLTRSFSLPIYTDDFVRRPPGVPHFAYCADGTRSDTISIPDFLFWNWPQVGIADYEQTAEAILKAGDRPADDSRLFWIGNPATHPSRVRFLELAAADPRIRGVAVQWVKDGANSGAGRMETAESNYVTLAEHCNYRYLIDLEGRGYSARVKLLMFSNRPLLLQERRWKEFYYRDLVPMRHYIPLSEDLSDLASQLDWLEMHPIEATQIAANAREFALARLRRRHAVEELARQLMIVGGAAQR